MHKCDPCEMGDCYSCEGDPCQCGHLCRCGRDPLDCICDRAWEERGEE